jgi:transcriptional regulator with XRE-family HTH domain
MGTYVRMQEQPTVETNQGLGRAVRDLRFAMGLSQEELAARCGLHRTYVGGIERGRRNPTCAILERLARGLGVRPWELLRRGDQLATEGDR